MEGNRRSPEIPPLNGMPDAGRAVDDANAFLRQLIPFPSSESVGPLSLLPMPSRGAAAHPNTVDQAAATAGDPVASIVSQAAAVLDEEMARGVLAARSSAGTAPGFSNADHPVLRQMHEFVNSLGALWPNLQGKAAQAPSAHPLATTGAEALATVRPRTPAKPGERATISMSLRNRESQPVRLVPTVTDLLGSRGGRIPNALLEFTPAEIVLEPQEQKDLEIALAVPIDAPAGCYSGLLVATGLDYLRALITIDVVTTNTTAASPQALSPLRSAVAPEGMPPATRNRGVMQEATRLAEDGELGNSDAIRLLQLAHRPEDVKDVLNAFEKQLTREAKSKLTLGAFVPLPDGVDNQRYEPIFDRYPVTGKTYATASGTVVLNEVQYYNGEMVQLYGECSDVARTSEVLAGSGYKPLTMRHPDGRESAIAQFWAHQLTDTSLKPYDASFLIIVAVPDHTAAGQACIAADANGVSSVLPMFDGVFDPDRSVYENRAQLFYVRLLDSTRIAIEVGRERMGTDKRPGTIQLRREGKRRSFSVNDGTGNAVANIDFVIADDQAAYLREVARAAATAGIEYRALPAGTEYVYPAVARIGNGPVSNWQWRSDVVPRLQRVEPNTVTFDSRSEVGELLLRWGFVPKVLGYIPNVRGVVTGVP